MTSSGGIIRSLSASQAEEFDPEQVGGCPRRWRLHRIDRLPVPASGAAQQDGDAGHALFAAHYRGEPLPKRVRMLKAVRGALAVGRLPALELGQLVESRFDGQPARDANGERVPLDTARTLWLGGVPWDGYVDLRFHRAGMITVLDHKFSSDIHTYAKTDLLSTVQMPVYALDSLRIWPEAQNIELVHNYVSRRGVDSLYVRQLVTVAQVRQRGEQIARLAALMQAAAVAKSADDVPANKKSCHTWSGCPFQSRCSAFKEKPKMNLEPEEMEWLNVVGGEETGRATGPVGEPAPLPGFLKERLQSPGSGADHATKLEIASAAGALDPADEDPFAVFAPVASVPQEQPPTCPDCSTELTAENGSQRDGKWKHIGCPADDAPVVASGIIPKSCLNCPHPAHTGAACTGKRGRGACRCGAQSPAASAVPGDYTARIPLGAELLVAESAALRAAAESITGAPLDAEAGRERSAVQSGHLPTCVESDAGKWLCMEGCTAGQQKAPTTEDEIDDSLSEVLTHERGTHRRILGELDASERDLRVARSEARPGDVRVVNPPPTGWTGTLQVNVNLGPETLALLQRLLGGR